MLRIILFSVLFIVLAVQAKYDDDREEYDDDQDKYDGEYGFRDHLVRRFIDIFVQ